MLHEDDYCRWRRLHYQDVLFAFVSVSLSLSIKCNTMNCLLYALMLVVHVDVGIMRNHLHFIECRVYEDNRRIMRDGGNWK